MIAFTHFPLESFICLLVGLLASLTVIPLILRVAMSKRLRGVLADRKELHHTHSLPTPRFGGVALAVAFLSISAYSRWIAPLTSESGPSSGRVLFWSSLCMFAIGLWDDIKPLGARRKLFLQIGVACAVCLSGIGIHVYTVPFTGQVVVLPWGGSVLTVLWILAITNLINLIDGVDGLAGGISLMLMALIACIGNHTGNLQLVGAGMVGALLGFLRYNFPPAKIYLGDGGSFFLGFQIAVMSLVNSHKGEVFGALAAPMIVLGLPIADMALAIFRRGLRGLPIFRPDRKHLHHRLLGMGFSKNRVVLSFYGLTLLFFLFAIVAFSLRRRFQFGLSLVSVGVLLVCAKSLRFSRPWFAIARVITESLKIRREVTYTLCVTRLLIADGARSKNISVLWDDLVFSLRKLDCTSVSFSGSGLDRVWSNPACSGSARSVRYELKEGLLVLGVPAPPGSPRICGSEYQADEHNAINKSSANFEMKVWEIKGELIAEAWAKALSAHLEKSKPSVVSAPIQLSPSSPFGGA